MIVFRYMKIFLLMYLCSCYLHASVANPPKTSIKPSRSVLFIKPGETYDGSFFVTNEAEKAISVRVFAEDWTEMSKNKRVRDFEGWLTLEEKQIIIESSKTKQVKYQILLPEDIAGEKLAQVYFQPSYNDGTKSTIKTRTGVLVVVIVEGTELIEIGEPTLALIKEDEESTPQVILGMKNKGNVLLRWKTMISLKDNNTNKIIGKAILEGQNSLLPETSKEIQGKLDDYISSHSDDLSAEIVVHYGIQSEKENKKEFTVPVRTDL